MKLLPIARALACLLLVATACDDPKREEPDIFMTAGECADEGGRVSPNPGAGAPSCKDDEVQIGWVDEYDDGIHATEVGRCCKPR